MLTNILFLAKNSLLGIKYFSLEDVLPRTNLKLWIHDGVSVTHLSFEMYAL